MLKRWSVNLTVFLREEAVSKAPPIQNVASYFFLDNLGQVIMLFSLILEEELVVD